MVGGERGGGGLIAEWLGGRRSKGWARVAAAALAAAVATPPTCRAAARPICPLRPQVPCEAFTGGAPGSGAPGAQPFRVQVTPAAEVRAGPAPSPEAPSHSKPYYCARAALPAPPPGSLRAPSPRHNPHPPPNPPQMVMDFHAHMDKHEVIGLLAGSWHPESCTLRVERAVPVNEALAGGSDGTNVEMDTDDQFKVGGRGCLPALAL
jgi:hypothetical protein